MNESGFFQFLNHWWNLPYLVMLGLVAVFFVLQFVGMAGGDHDADAHEHDVEAAANAGFGWQEVLSFFGVGRVPLMVVWVTFCMFAGFTGIFFNSTIFVNHGGVYPSWGYVASPGASFLVGLVAVRIFSRLAARFVDVGGHGPTRKHELSGKRGIVASLELDARFGEVRVRDARGNELLLHGRLHRDEPALKRGQKVVLVDYDPERELFWVTKSPEEEEGKRP